MEQQAYRTEVVSLGPTDRLAILVPNRMTPEAAHVLRQQVAELWLGVPIGRIGVFHDGIELKIVSEAKPEEPAQQPEHKPIKFREFT